MRIKTTQPSEAFKNTSRLDEMITISDSESLGAVEIKKKEVALIKLTDFLDITADGVFLKQGTLKSKNFVRNLKGWAIDAEGNAWFKVVTAAGYVQTFRQAAIPTSLHIGDIWFDSDDSDKMYQAAAAGATTIAAGAWVRVDVGANPTLIDALATTNAPAEAAATVGATFGTNITGGGSANTQITNNGYATLFRQDKFGNGADGDVTISSNTSLTADMFYNNLTVNTGIVLNTKGFRIFVKGTLNCVGTGKIVSNGGSGGNGGNGTDSNTGGAAGSAGAVDYSSGTLPLPLAGRAGGEGADEVDSVAGVGANGVDAAKGLGSAGTNGGRGGDGQAGGGQTAGAAGGTGGSKTGTVLDYPKSYTTSINLFDKNGTAIAQHTISASPGGGGGGGKGPTNTSSGGGGGGSGSTGGLVWIAAKTVTNINAEAKGGAGGNGGNSSSDGGSYRGGVGAAGAGGSGGVIILIYETLTTSSLDVAGGAAGALGTLGITTNSTAAQAGNTGVTILIIP